MVALMIQIILQTNLPRCLNLRVFIVSEMTYNVSMGTLNPTIPTYTCVPNSHSRHDSLKTKFMTQFHKCIDNTTLLSCNVDLVDDCVRHLKRGKAVCHDELAVKHLQYAHPISVVLLSSLFNMLTLHGMVPLDFGKIKTPDGDKTICDNIIGALLLVQC